MDVSVYRTPLSPYLPGIGPCVAEFNGPPLATTTRPSEQIRNGKQKKERIRTEKLSQPFLKKEDMAGNK